MSKTEWARQKRMIPSETLPYEAMVAHPLAWQRGLMMSTSVARLCARQKLCEACVRMDSGRAVCFNGGDGHRVGKRFWYERSR